MTWIRITKEQVITALREEPLTTLRAGKWIRVDDDLDDDSYTVGDPACAVCAVGAVLRRALAPEQQIRAIENAAQAATRNATTNQSYSSYPVVQRMLREGDYLAALSSVFERFYQDAFELNDHHGIVEEVRDICITFVEETFPESFVTDIDGARPADGVEVVE